jgi:hypothetical protein
MTKPLSGTLLYSFSFCCVEVIAPRTDSLQHIRIVKSVYVRGSFPNHSLSGLCVPVNTGFDVRRGPVLVRKHLVDARDLILRRSDQGDHARAVPARKGIDGDILRWEEEGLGKVVCSQMQRSTGNRQQEESVHSPSRSLQTFDQLLHFPHLHLAVLLGISIRLAVGHLELREVERLTEGVE